MYPSPSSGGKMLSGVCESVDSNTLLPALSYLPVPYFFLACARDSPDVR